MFQFLGCIIIGYMAWVLATSVTVSRFIDGTMVSFGVVLVLLYWFVMALVLGNVFVLVFGIFIGLFSCTCFVISLQTLIFFLVLLSVLSLFLSFSFLILVLVLVLRIILILFLSIVLGFNIVLVLGIFLVLYLSKLLFLILVLFLNTSWFFSGLFGFLF